MGFTAEVSSLADLNSATIEHVDALGDVAEESGVCILDVGIDPDRGLDEVQWMPSSRHQTLREYMSRRGSLAHRTMAQTASIQCSIDYHSELDWCRKFRAGILLSPIVVAMFANSTSIDRRDSGYKSYRQRCWHRTDPERCDLPPFVFGCGNLGFESWTNWVCQMAWIVRKERSLYVPTGDLQFKEALEENVSIVPSFLDWQTHLSTVLTPVRSSEHIELRSADAQPPGRMLAVPSFWCGILYHEESLSEALRLGSRYDSPTDWRFAMDSACRLALDGEAGGTGLRELAGNALSIGAHGLRSGAACSDLSGDPAEPLVRLAHELGLSLA